MSSGVDVRRRPGIWSYFSFPGGNTRRRTSVSLPRNNIDAAQDDDDDDPYEKPDRRSHGHRSVPSNSLMNDYKVSTMNGGQRVRFLKTGGIIAFIFLILYFIAPKDSLSKAGGEFDYPTHNEKHRDMK